MQATLAPLCKLHISAHAAFECRRSLRFCMAKNMLLHNFFRGEFVWAALIRTPCEDCTLFKYDKGNKFFFCITHIFLHTLHFFPLILSFFYYAYILNLRSLKFLLDLFPLRCFRYVGPRVQSSGQGSSDLSNFLFQLHHSQCLLIDDPKRSIFYHIAQIKVAYLSKN